MYSLVRRVQTPAVEPATEPCEHSGSVQSTDTFQSSGQDGAAMQTPTFRLAGMSCKIW